MTSAFGRLGQAIRRGLVGEPDGRVPDLAASRSIELLAADLRRLGEEAARLRHDQQIYARVFRLRVAGQAYDDTLLLACAALEVDTDGLCSPLGDVDRLRLEAELSRRGLVW